MTDDNIFAVFLFFRAKKLYSSEKYVTVTVLAIAINSLLKVRTSDFPARKLACDALALSCEPLRWRQLAN